MHLLEKNNLMKIPKQYLFTLDHARGYRPAIFSVLLSGLFMLFLSFQVKAQDEPKDLVVKPEPDGSLVLTAEKGEGIGIKIAYMPEWRAFGWFTALDRVEWEVDVKQAGKYDVFMEWSVSDESAGTPYIFQASGKEVKGKVKKTGSWETFKTRKIGTIRLQEGKQKMVFKGDESYGKAGLLDLRNIRLVPKN